jgi:2Fe-2S ferredoxin
MGFCFRAAARKGWIPAYAGMTDIRAGETCSESALPDAAAGGYRQPQMTSPRLSGSRIQAKRRSMPKMVFLDTQGNRREVDAPTGLSVLEVAHKHGIDLEGACEGSLACSTCHVIIDPSWFEVLKDPTEDEEDMLDLAFGLTKTSRLGCQIVMSEELDGLVVSLPPGSRNLLK